MGRGEIGCQQGGGWLPGGEGRVWLLEGWVEDNHWVGRDEVGRQQVRRMNTRLRGESLTTSRMGGRWLLGGEGWVWLQAGVEDDCWAERGEFDCQECVESDFYIFRCSFNLLQIITLCNGKKYLRIRYRTVTSDKFWICKNNCNIFFCFKDIKKTLVFRLFLMVHIFVFFSLFFYIVKRVHPPEFEGLRNFLISTPFKKY